MAKKRIPSWFPKVEDILDVVFPLEAGGEKIESGTVLVTIVDGDDNPTAVLLFPNAPSGSCSFCDKENGWRCQRSLDIGFVVVEVRRNGVKLLPTKQDKEDALREQIIESQLPLLRQLGIPEDSELAGVALPDLGDTVIIRFGGASQGHRTEPCAMKVVVSTVMVISGQPDWPNYDSSDKYFKCNLRDAGEWKLGYFNKENPGWRMISEKGNGIFPAEVEIIRSKG